MMLPFSEDEIPECSDGNTVQTRFQYLLEQKLDFTTDSARAYGNSAATVI